MRLRIGSILLICSAAHAQPGNAPPYPTSEPATTTVDQGTVEDANSGRVAIMPTALTPPAGTFAFEDLELLLIGASYAPTDNFVLTATTMVPVTSDFYWGFLSGKLQLVKSGNLRMAAQAGVFGVTDQKNGSDSTAAFDLGAVLTYCIDPACYSHVDASAVAGFARQSNSSVPVGFSGGLVGRVGRHVRLVFEADTAHLFGRLNDQANGFLGWYGVRFTSRNIGVDLELVKPFCTGDCSSKAFPLGFPFVTFSYRAID
jgi:hypothetical protein